MKQYTKEQWQVIHDYLIEVIKNNWRCQHCKFYHNNICSFAYECVKNGFSYNEEEE